MSLFSVTPRDAPDDPDQWLCSVARHWNLDRPDPR
jgi:predicted RNA polymerase sigma factor